MVTVRRSERDEELAAAVRCYNRAWRVGYHGSLPDRTVEAELRPEGEAGVEVLEELTRPHTVELFVAVEDDHGDGGDDGDGSGSSDGGSGDGDVLGYVVGQFAITSDHVPEGDAETVELYVDPAHWREGVGTALHDRFVRYLPDDTAGVVVEILGENQRAQAFFESLGYEFLDTDVVELANENRGVGYYRLDLGGSQ